MEKEELQEKIVHPEIVAEVEKKMLSESEFEDMALLFKMFADSTRLKVLKALFEREMCVGDLAVLLKMTHSAVSHQLASLKKTRLVRSRKDGKVVYYSLDDDHIEEIFQKALDHVRE